MKYYTGVYVIPCVPNGESYKYEIEHQQWSGKERHIAKKEVESLAQKYKCKIVSV